MHPFNDLESNFLELDGGRIIEQAGKQINLHQEVEWKVRTIVRIE